MAIIVTLQNSLSPFPFYYGVNGENCASINGQAYFNLLKGENQLFLFV